MKLVEVSLEGLNRVVERHTDPAHIDTKTPSCASQLPERSRTGAFGFGGVSAAGRG